MAGTILNTRVDPDVLEDAEKILKILGISRSVAINMFFTEWLSSRKACPGSQTLMKRSIY